MYVVCKKRILPMHIDSSSEDMKSYDKTEKIDPGVEFLMLSKTLF